MCYFLSFPCFGHKGWLGRLRKNQNKIGQIKRREIRAQVFAALFSFSVWSPRRIQAIRPAQTTPGNKQADWKQPGSKHAGDGTKSGTGALEANTFVVVVGWVYRYPTPDSKPPRSTAPGRSDEVLTCEAHGRDKRLLYLRYYAAYSSVPPSAYCTTNQ